MEDPVQSLDQEDTLEKEMATHSLPGESHGGNGIVITVNKRVQNGVLGCNLKNDRMISVRFQDKSFNITVIQVYAPSSNAEEAEVEWFYEDLQDLLEITPRKDVFFIIGDWNEKEEVKKHLG